MLQSASAEIDAGRDNGPPRPRQAPQAMGRLRRPGPRPTSRPKQARRRAGRGVQKWRYASEHTNRAICVGRRVGERRIESRSGRRRLSSQPYSAAPGERRKARGGSGRERRPMKPEVSSEKPLQTKTILRSPCSVRETLEAAAARPSPRGPCSCYAMSRTVVPPSDSRLTRNITLGVVPTCVGPHSRDARTTGRRRVGLTPRPRQC